VGRASGRGSAGVDQTTWPQAECGTSVLWPAVSFRVEAGLGTWTCARLKNFRTPSDPNGGTDQVADGVSISPGLAQACWGIRGCGPARGHCFHG